jgi:hypothetical protein
MICLIKKREVCKQGGAAPQARHALENAEFEQIICNLQSSEEFNRKHMLQQPVAFNFP